jgi:two-component system response regulator DegU
MNLLIVDDSEPMRRTIRRVVGDLAREIHECGDGADALFAYRRLSPDWVLMDVEMPGLDGLRATREITGIFPDAKVVIVSRHDDDELREAASAAGARGYVVKENLLDLRRVLGARGPLRGGER